MPDGIVTRSLAIVNPAASQSTFASAAGACTSGIETAARERFRSARVHGEWCNQNEYLMP
jgi:hypothetical protein